MSHHHKGTLAQKTVEWAKHLKPFGKRRQAKLERKAAANHIRSESNPA